MRTWWMGVVVAAVILAAPGLADSTAVAPATSKATASKAEKSKSKSKSQAMRTKTSLEVERVVLRVNHRVFQNFVEVDTVGLGEEFPIGDGEMTARIIDFVPDFTIERGRGVVSRSDEPRNPAFRIAVAQDGAPHDSSWAFLNFPPHFSMKALLAFQVLRIDFAGRDPLLNPGLRDSSAAEGHRR